MDSKALHDLRMSYSAGSLTLPDSLRPALGIWDDALIALALAAVVVAEVCSHTLIAEVGVRPELLHNVSFLRSSVEPSRQ